MNEYEQKKKNQDSDEVKEVASIIVDVKHKGETTPTATITRVEAAQK